MKKILTFILISAIVLELPDNSKAENPGDCSFFGRSMCNYKTFKQDWDWSISGIVDGSGDHTTTNSAASSFAAIDDYYKANSTTARLYSPQLEPTGPRQLCLTFWYRYMGRRMKNFRVIQQIGEPNDIGGLIIWNTTQPTNHVWTYAQVPVSSNYTFVIHFEANRYKKTTSGKNNFIDVDDIVFTKGPCTIQPDSAQTNSTPNLPPKEKKEMLPTPPSNSPDNCTFENNTLCTWKQAEDNVLNWTLRRGAASQAMYTGPKYDHTRGSKKKKGYYIYIDVKDKYLGKAAKLISDYIQPKNAQCLTFWYHMWGANVNTLNVFSQVGNQTSQVVWSRKRTQGNNWLRADVNFKQMTEEFKIVFEAIADKSSQFCSIALDDISLSKFECPENDNPCDFETSSCRYTAEGKDIWKVTGKHYSPDAPIAVDHTFNTDYGHYMALDTSHLDIGDDIELKSSYLDISTTKCLQFWYYMNIGITTKFNVTLDHGKTTIIENNYFSGFTGSWQVAQATLNETAFSSKLYFYSTIMSNTDFIAIDDIQITDGACNRLGECNFEDENLCTWSNGADDQFDWQLQNGKTISTGTGPMGDHTLGSDKGTYLYIETSAPQRLRDKARLYSHGFQVSEKPWKCLHFWYNMIGRDIGRLTVYQTFQAGNENPLWQARGDQGYDGQSDWHYAQISVPSNINSYRLIFEATVGGSLGDIAIDDIMITDDFCSIIPYNANNSIVLVPTVAPPEPEEAIYKQIECNFKEDFCRWSNVNTSMYNNWVIVNSSKPLEQQYFPPGKDYAMAQNDIYAPNMDSVIYTLKTPLFKTKPEDEAICFHFYYYMFGLSEGLLTVYIDLYESDNKIPTTFIAWRRNKHSIDKWQRAPITLNLPDQKISLRIEAIISDSNVIAIRTFELYMDSCPESEECDFTMHSCGWATDMNGTVAWGVVRAKEEANGPSTDHTSLTPDGAFAYVENNVIPAHGRLISSKYSKYKGTQCLSFWYYMSGAGNGLLSVQLGYKMDENDTTYTTDLWQRIGDRGNRWHRAEVTISAYEDFYVAFFANFTNAKLGSFMGVDDIMMLPSECDLPGTCNFDKGFCGYINDPDQKNNWMISYGRTYNPHNVVGPVAFDHGMYAYMDYTSGAHLAEPVSRLRSEAFRGTNQSHSFCLEFAYVKFEKYGSTSFKVFVNRLDRLEGLELPIWQAVEDSSFSHWSRANVVFNCTVEFELIFEATNSISSSAFIGIDDISLHVGPNCKEPETVTNNTEVQDELFRCDFDDANKCAWVLSNADNQYDDWKVSHGLAEKDTGPKFDHTLKTNKGFYALADKWSSTSRMATNETIKYGKAACFQFWYNAYSPYSSIHLLQIYLRTEFNRETLVWNGTATSGGSWQFAQISIRNYINYEIIIQASIRKYSSGYIAVDDVVLLLKECPMITSCSFDNGMCDFNQRSNSPIDWTLTQNEKLKYFPVDHTTNTKQGGNYLYLNTTFKPAATHASLISGHLSAGKYCAHFWFYSTNAGSVLNVQKSTYYAEEELAVFESIRRNLWLSASVEVYHNEGFQISFDVIPGKRESPFAFALDDIEITPGSCHSKHFCDFEQDLCNWQVDENSDITWERENGYNIRKNNLNQLPDHTLGLPSGHTLLIETYYKMNDAVAILHSPIVLKEYNCFSFWYFTNNVKLGVFEIWQQFATNESGTEVLITKEREWVQVKIDINTITNLNSKLNIEFYFKNDRVDSFISLDDFFFDTKYCQFSEVNIPASICNFSSPDNNCSSCSFENGTCNYSDASADTYHWRLGNQTEASSFTGGELDTVDHTAGTAKGQFMYAAVKGSPSEYVTAKLHSPRYEYATATCHMSFWIFLPSGTTAENALGISIVYLTGDEALKIVNIDGIEGQWALVSVYIGSIQQPFRVEFETLNYYRNDEFVALDDINMIDCGFANKESDTCSSEEIPCSNKPNSTCISRSQECDFNIDCISSTDEANCTTKNYTMCDFEDNNMCVWTTQWQGWNLAKANSFTKDRDHTTNSREGSFLAAEYIAYTSSKISSRTFQAGNCTMRFHYVIGGDGVKKFKVSTTTASDPEKVWFSKDRRWGNYFLRDEIHFQMDADFIISLEADISQYSGFVLVDDVSFDPNCKFAEQELDKTVPEVCKDGQFRCGDDTCIKQTSVCDFEKDCKDGSDEINCGNCDFQNGECGWSDSSVGTFRWTRMQGLLGTTASDGPPDGLMRVIKSTKSYSALPNAYLESPILGKTATTCKFSFMYHTNDIDGKFKLNVRNIGKWGNRFEKTIAILNNSGSDNWIKRTIPLGGFLPGYQIVFEADVTENHLKGNMPDFAIDEVQFTDCSAANEATPTYTNLNCTFEEGNTCHWHQELAEDDLDWGTAKGLTNGTGPGSDHTNNSTGHYIYVSTFTPGSYSSAMEAWLISPIMPATSGQTCLTFWYHMFGEYVGAIGVAVFNATNKVDMWAQHESEGNVWRPAFVNIDKQLQNYQIEIWGQVYTHSPHIIAIDDIEYSNSSCISGTYETNFESNDGGWVHNFSKIPHEEWKVVRMSYEIRGVDHTTSTKYGHALNFNGYDGSTAVVNNPTKFQSSNKGSCFQFWYMMSDNKYSNLVVARIIDSKRLHKMYKTFNSYVWNFGQITIPPNKLFQIDFRATVVSLDHKRHSFFLDDFIIRNESCLPDGSCDFESSSCGWSSSSSRRNKWLRSSAATPSKLSGPGVDATGNNEGSYMFLASVLGISGETDITSPELTSTKLISCFSFSYYISGPDVGSLQVEVELSNYNTINIFKVTGPTEKKWIPVHLEIHNITKYYIIRVIGILNKSPMGNIAIDNFTVTPDICPQKLVIPPTTTTSTTITTPTTTLKITSESTKQTPVTQRITSSTTKPPADTSSTKMITKPVTEETTIEILSKSSTQTATGCSTNEHSCSPNGKCIHSVYWCDGTKDCPDGEDEAICEDRKCREGTFSCSSEPGKCIENERLCDGSSDCTDRSDESLCECYTDLCLHNAKCTKQEKLAVCNCADNYEGNRCQFEAQTRKPESQSNQGWIAGVVIGVILAIGLGVAFYFKKYRHPTITENTPMTIDNPMYENADEPPAYQSDPDTTIPSPAEETTDGGGIVNPLYSK